jgi:hypothetical protein
LNESIQKSNGRD